MYLKFSYVCSSFSFPPTHIVGNLFTHHFCWKLYNCIIICTEAQDKFLGSVTDPRNKSLFYVIIPLYSRYTFFPSCMRYIWYPFKYIKQNKNENSLLIVNFLSFNCNTIVMLPNNNIHLFPCENLQFLLFNLLRLFLLSKYHFTSTFLSYLLMENKSFLIFLLFKQSNNASVRRQ